VIWKYGNTQVWNIRDYAGSLKAVRVPVVGVISVRLTPRRHGAAPKTRASWALALEIARLQLSTVHALNAAKRPDDPHTRSLNRPSPYKVTLMRRCGTAKIALDFSGGAGLGHGGDCGGASGSG